MKEIDWLQEEILIEASILCTSCKLRRGNINIDDYSFAELLIAEGWRHTPNNVYCPSCAKKKLKPRK